MIFLIIVNSYYLDLSTLFKSDNAILGGDLFYEIIPIKLALDGNLIGFTSNLGWPNGYSSWFYPLVGIGPQIIAFLIGLIGINLNIFFVYNFCILIGNILNFFTSYWMSYQEFENKRYPLIIGLLVALSPFILYRADVVSLTWFYFPILILGVWFRSTKNMVSIKKVFFITFFFGIFSPYWWTTIVLFLTLTLAIIYFLNIKKFFKEIKFWIATFVASILSLIPGLYLYWSYGQFVGPSGRNPWQSNIFGGRLSDLLVTSPFLNSKFSFLKKISDGNSPEAYLNQFGLVFLLGSIVALGYMVKSFIEKSKLDTLHLALIIFVFFAYFIVGGLGNLQAAIFVLIDQATIARSWARLLLFISIIGIFIFFKYLSTKKLRPIFIYVISVLLVLISLLDLNSSQKIKIVSITSFPEYEPTNFIKINTNNCPILQLPIDTYPIPQDFLFQNGASFAYNEFIPYLINDRNKWSIGAIPNNQFWLENIQVPSQINSEYVNSLKNKGYCGILFDKEFANWQISRSAGIDRTKGSLTADGNWPGTQIIDVKPNFENSRYKVYLF